MTFIIYIYVARILVILTHDRSIYVKNMWVVVHLRLRFPSFGAEDHSQVTMKVP